MAASAASIAEYLLPQGKKHGREWKVGSVAGEAGTSLSICIGGPKVGVWKDFAMGETGDLLDLWCACRSVGLADAIRDAKRFLGIRDEMPQRERPTFRRPERPKCKHPTNVVGDWLSARGLTDTTIAAFRVAEQERGDKTYAVFPYLRENDNDLVNVKYRNIADKKDMRQEGGAEACLFGWHLIAATQRVVAITEGELDAMTLHQVGIQLINRCSWKMSSCRRSARTRRRARLGPVHAFRRRRLVLASRLICPP